MKMDNKYIGDVFKNNGTLVPRDEWIVFRAKDLALIPTLQSYLRECIRLGCDQEHLNGIDKLMQRVYKFQKENPEICKKPD